MNASYVNPKNRTFSNWQELEKWIVNEREYDIHLKSNLYPLDFGLYPKFTIVDTEPDCSITTESLEAVLVWAKQQGNAQITFRFLDSEVISKYKVIDHWSVTWEVPFGPRGHMC